MERKGLAGRVYGRTGISQDGYMESSNNIMLTIVQLQLCGLMLCMVGRLIYWK